MSSREHGLQECEELIAVDEELQWRQVHPNYVDDGVVARDAFVGTDDATDEVSTVRSSVRTAAQAYDFYVTELALMSAGTWGVNGMEIATSACRAIDDGNCAGVETPGHSFIDMRGLGKKERKLARATLATAATHRGRAHPTS